MKLIWMVWYKSKILRKTVCLELEAGEFCVVINLDARHYLAPRWIKLDQGKKKCIMLVRNMAMSHEMFYQCHNKNWMQKVYRMTHIISVFAFTTIWSCEHIGIGIPTEGFGSTSTRKTNKQKTDPTFPQTCLITDEKKHLAEVERYQRQAMRCTLYACLVLTIFLKLVTIQLSYFTCP